MENIIVYDANATDQIDEYIQRVFNKHGFVCVSDVYDAVGIKSTSKDDVYGWTDIKGMGFVKTVQGDGNKGYMFCAPPETRLDNELLYVKPKMHIKYPDDPMVSHPPHYQSPNGMEVIDVIENFTTDLNGIEATDTGNIIKYICRWKHKNGLQDLKKAQWYLNHLITHIEKIEKESN